MAESRQDGKAASSSAQQKNSKAGFTRRSFLAQPALRAAIFPPLLKAAELKNKSALPNSYSLSLLPISDFLPFQYFGAIGALPIPRYDCIEDGATALLQHTATADLPVAQVRRPGKRKEVLMDQLWNKLWGEENARSVSDLILILVLIGLVAASIARVLA